MQMNSKRYLLSLLLLHPWVALAACALAGIAAETGAERQPLVPATETLAGVHAFLGRTACADGSFQPGVDPAYPGMSDSAYSDLAPVAYAVILHKTFGWELPRQAKTQAFLLGRQQADGAFRNERGTADPRSAQARVYNTTQGIVALHAL